MALEKEEKTQVITEFRTHGKDTGSTEVQIAVLSQRIVELAKHVKASPKDVSSRRGLVLLVGKRRGLLSYFKSKNPDAYVGLLQKLGLRK